jgi:uncharacterized protein YgbK (DUF1537 family)
VIVGADDRTGALEVAGSCAADDGAVEVTVWPTRPVAAGVVDLDTRDLDPASAARRAVALAPAAWKLDSRLRGNWPAELRALAAVSGRAVWVVAALPSMGRVCVDGLVRSSTEVFGRPSDVLGGAAVVWDAATEADLVDVGARWRALPERERPVLAGTSAALAAALAPAAAPRPTRLPAPIVVACGSLHPSARAELGVLPPSVVVVATDPELVVEPAHAAWALAERVRGLGPIGTLVVVGGATAAAILGDGPLLVGGLLAPGVPWARRPHGTGPVIVTRSGGFHGPAALAPLLEAHCVP